MGSALENGSLGREISAFLDSRMAEQGIGLRSMSRLTGIKLTRLGDLLRRDRPVTPDEIDRIAAQLGMRASEVVRHAENVLARARDDSSRKGRPAPTDGAGPGAPGAPRALAEVAAVGPDVAGTDRADGAGPADGTDEQAPVPPAEVLRAAREVAERPEHRAAHRHDDVGEESQLPPADGD